MDGDRARNPVKLLEGPLTIESGLLARLVKRADGTIDFEVWDGARWTPASGREAGPVILRVIVTDPEGHPLRPINPGSQRRVRLGNSESIE